MVCLAWAGGNSAIYRDWEFQGVEVCAVELPGRLAYVCVYVLYRVHVSYWCYVCIRAARVRVRGAEGARACGPRTGGYGRRPSATCAPSLSAWQMYVRAPMCARGARPTHRRTQ
jgi:hypothetical protein